MTFKVIMDSGKEYIVSNYHVQDFITSLYNSKNLPTGGTIIQMENNFMFIDDEKKILFNPTHVSSIEILE